MKLPLQMQAVSRGRFSQSRNATLAGNLFPSAQNLCNGTLCACPNGIVCCDKGQSCGCDDVSNRPVCGGRTHHAGKQHDHAVVTCYEKGNPTGVDCY